MNNDDYLQVIRSLINRETSLQNNRLTWFLKSQSLFAAACGVFWDKNPYALAIVLFLGFSSAAATIPGLFLLNYFDIPLLNLYVFKLFHSYKVISTLKSHSYVRTIS